MRKSSYLPLFVGSAFVIGACSSAGSDLPDLGAVGSGGATETSEAGSVRLSGSAAIVDQDLADVADVRDDRILFPASAFQRLAAYRSGDILISDRQTLGTSGKNPNGFLRKVRSVASTSEGTTVMTDSAALQEAVDELNVHTAFDLPELGLDGPVGTRAVTGLRPQGEGGGAGRTFDYSGTKLFEVKDTAKARDGSDVPYSIYATIETGKLSYKPTFNADMSIGLGKVGSFSLRANGDIQAALVLAAGLKTDDAGKDLAQPLKKTYSQPLADYDVPIDSVRIGRFKMPATVHFHATLTCDLDFTAPVEAKIGGTASGSVDVNVGYANGKLSSTVTKSVSAKLDGPTYTKEGFVRAYCSVEPAFRVDFFSKQTVGLTASAYEGAGGSLTCGGQGSDGKSKVLVSGDAEAGLSVRANAVLDLFGYHFDKECLLFDRNELVRYDTTYPYPDEGSCKVSGPYPLPARPPVQPDACFSAAIEENGGSNDGNGSGQGNDGSGNGSGDNGNGGNGGDGNGNGADGGPGIIQGTCTHDVCTAGDKLGQQCDDCTMKVCAADPYCCDTFWGLSCFDSVEKYCGKTCGD